MIPMRKDVLIYLVRWLPGLVFWFASVQASHAEAGHGWTVLAGKPFAIEVDHQRVVLTPALKAAVHHAEAAATRPWALNGMPNKGRLWLLVRQASRANGGASFCGAGHEDRLLLIQVVKSVGKPVGGLLVQSCLQSISMDADNLDDILGAINVNEHDGTLNFQRSMSNDITSFRQDVTIGIEASRMKVMAHKVAD